MNNQKGFTLAEVLITLGIIGIVAALTLPVLIQNHKKSETTARLKKFYSIMSQAIVMSENDNGPIDDWIKAEADEIDEETGKYNASEYVHSKEYFDRYFKDYIKYIKTEKDQNTHLFKVTLTDGSSVLFRNGNCTDIVFDVNGDTRPNEDGKDRYTFLICKKDYNRTNRNFSTYIRTKKETTRADRLKYCKDNPIYCSALLEYDNWEFKKDYPYRL